MRSSRTGDSDAMTAKYRSPVIWIVSSAEALHGLERRLARRGMTTRRIVTIEFVAEDPGRLRTRLGRWGAFDTLLVTSPRAVSAFVRPVLNPRDRLSPRLETWAAGGTSATALRRLGLRRVRRAEAEGADALLPALARGRARAVLYPRSDLAGPTVARRLRAQGHRVLDLVVYRTLPRTVPSAALKRLLRPGQTVVVTSPSALAALRRQIPPIAFRRWRGTTRVVALGSRTRRSAQGHGFRRVEEAGSASVEGLTALLARGGRHASE